MDLGAYPRRRTLFHKEPYVQERGVGEKRLGLWKKLVLLEKIELRIYRCMMKVQLFIGLQRHVRNRAFSSRATRNSSVWSKHSEWFYLHTERQGTTPLSWFLQCKIYRHCYFVSALLVSCNSRCSLILQLENYVALSFSIPGRRSRWSCNDRQRRCQCLWPEFLQA